MKIRFSPGLPIVLLVLGPFSAATSLLTGQVLSVAVGGLLVLLGVLMLVNPMMIIEADEVRVRNPLGMTVKRFAVASPAELRFDGNVLWHVPENRKIGSLGFGVRREDRRALRAQVERR